MSKYARMRAEAVMSGQMPKVAILGSHDYVELMGELETFYGLQGESEQAHSSPVKYQGIDIYTSFVNTRGFWFGDTPV